MQSYQEKIQTHFGGQRPLVLLKVPGRDGEPSRPRTVEQNYKLDKRYAGFITREESYFTKFLFFSSRLIVMLTAPYTKMFISKPASIIREKVFKVVLCYLRCVSY